jgi:hypothetical protein
MKIVLFAIALVFAGLGAGATEVELFKLETAKSFLGGSLEGVAIDTLGRLQLAARAEKVTGLDEPFLFAAAAHPEGWVLGTGGEGKVLLVRRDGRVETLFAAPEGQIFALWVDPDGTVFAGASPGGTIYRIPKGGPGAAWAATGETYVWALARARDGRLLAATGTEGKLLAFDAGGKDAKVLFDTDDSHVRSLLVLADGRIALGTAGRGLVVELTADGTGARTRLDAEAPEIVALAPGPGGSIYAAAIASEASSVELAGKAKEDPAGEDSEREVSVATGPASVGSRPAGFTGKRSQLYEIRAGGRLESLWGFDDETVFALAAAGDRLWVGTGLEGKLYSWDGDRMVLEKKLDERQIVALTPAALGGARGARAPGAEGDIGSTAEGDLLVGTTNGAALYRFTTAERELSGSYTSAALDAGQAARFGVFRFRGDLGGGALKVAFRSGQAGEPDATWSDWGPAQRPSPTGEIALEGLPPGRFVQLRAELERGAAGRGPRIDAIELSFRQENGKPAISALSVLEPGQILVPSGFNPGNQAYEPAHPNRDGIFTTLESADTGTERTKTLWKKGFRTLRWVTSDPNSDDLIGALAVRRGSDGVGEWFPVAERLADDYYGFDATVLPDGVYRFRLRVSDAAANAPGQELTAERISEPVVIDHTAPALVAADRKGETVTLMVEDSWSPLVAVELSTDTRGWVRLNAADGLVDGRRETITATIPADAKLLLLRLTDAAYNVVTLDLLARVTTR